MKISLRTALVCAGLSILATGCGGGGGSSSGGSSAPVVPGGPVSGGTTVSATPTPVPGAPATPAPTPSPAVTASPLPVPSSTPVSGPGPIVDSQASPVALGANDSSALGTVTPNIIEPATANTPIDGIPCTVENSTGQLFHVHFSIYANNQQYAVPTSIGIYHSAVITAPYFYDAKPGDSAACVYALHVHDANGVVSIATVSPTAQFTLGQILDVWGVSLTANGFWTFSGPTRVFMTDESSGTAGNYPVTEITGIDPHTIVLTPKLEFTFEINGTENVPNYTFGPGL